MTVVPSLNSEWFCATNYDLVEAELSLVNFTHVYNMLVLECVSPAHDVHELCVYCQCHLCFP
jgi:hypothetical protein